METFESRTIQCAVLSKDGMYLPLIRTLFEHCLSPLRLCRPLTNYVVRMLVVVDGSVQGE